LGSDQKVPDTRHAGVQPAANANLERRKKAIEAANNREMQIR
jgi:hypothetical protein